MASSEDKNFNAGCLRGRSEAQMSLEKNIGSISTAATPLNYHPIRRQDEGFEGVARKLGRKGLLNIDLNVPPSEAPDGELTAKEGGRNGPETVPPPPADVAPDDSAKKAGISDEGQLNFNVEMRSAADAGSRMEENRGRNRRWSALLGVAENALREKKEEDIRKRKRGASQEAELGAEPPGTRKKIGQRRLSLVEEWNREVATEVVVVRSTRGRTVAMPSKYRDSVLGAAAVELPRHNKNGKSATVFHTKRRAR